MKTRSPLVLLRSLAVTLAVTLAASLSAAAPAQEPLAQWVSPTTGRPGLLSDYGVTYYPDRRVAGQDADLGMTRHDFSLLLPVWRDSGDELSASARMRLEELSTHAILPDTGERFPDELWDVRFGTNYRRRLDNDWIAGVGASLGSASDQPFHGSGELEAQATAFLRVPQGQRNAWLFLLSYSNNRETLNNVPLPGLAYWYQPSEELRLLLGFPFASLEARPWRDLTVQLSWVLIRTVHARATYRLLDPLSLYTGFDWRNERYLRVDRPDSDDRLFYYEKSLIAGLRVDLSKAVSLDATGGYAFDRFYFEGEDYSDRNHNRLDIGDAPFFSGRLGVKL